MKASKTSRAAADLVDVRRNGESGVTYKCLKCGFTMTASVYYDADYKTILAHAASCKGEKMESKALVPSRSRQIVNGEEVKLLAKRIKLCTPGGQRLNDEQAMALAQVAISADLNPFIGELYYIPGVGPDAGIEGMRRKAKEQSTFSIDIRPMRDNERHLHGLNDTDHGSICELYRHDVLRNAVEINKLAGKEIVPVKPVLGVGLWCKGDNVARTKTPQWMADKRAEKDAIRKAFDLGLNTAPGDDEWIVVDNDKEEEIARRETAIQAERVAQQTPLDAAVDKYNTPAYEDVPPDADPPAQADAQTIETAITRYGNGNGDSLPPSWANQLLEDLRHDPQASDPVGNGFPKQLQVSMDRRGILWDRATAFVETLLGHRVEECTLAEARVLMDLANDPTLVEKIAEVLG